jgi:hypothetical protein
LDLLSKQAGGGMPMLPQPNVLASLLQPSATSTGSGQLQTPAQMQQLMTLLSQINPQQQSQVQQMQQSQAQMQQSQVQQMQQSQVQQMQQSQAQMQQSKVQQMQQMANISGLQGALGQLQGLQSKTVSIFSCRWIILKVPTIHELYKIFLLLLIYMIFSYIQIRRLHYLLMHLHLLINPLNHNYRLLLHC